MTLPEGYTFRRLEVSDYSNNYLETLKALTSVGNISEDQYKHLFEEWSRLPEIYNPHVITNPAGKVVATGMLLIERKLIHECGSVGHVEDISVAPSEQGKKLGLSMVSRLTELAEKKGCYKVILDCSEHNVRFYEKCGYIKGGTEMVKRFT